LRGAFLECARELLSKISHIVTQLHDRNDTFDLIVNLVAPEFLEPLMMVSGKPRFRMPSAGATEASFSREMPDAHFRHDCEPAKLRTVPSPIEPFPGPFVPSGTGGLQFPVLTKRHQALFSLGAFCVQWPVLISTSGNSVSTRRPVLAPFHRNKSLVAPSDFGSGPFCFCLR
jgi:hypothetical protein